MMNDHTTADLIDKYLRNRLNEEEKRILTALLEADPNVRDELIKSKRAYRFLQYCSDRELKSRLASYDRDFEVSLLRKRRFMQTIIAGVILLLLGSWFLLHQYYSHENLALRYHVQAAARNEFMHAADSLFLQKDFREARRLYQPFIDLQVNNHYHDAAWNILLCRLALEGAGANWHHDLEIFIEGTDDRHHTRAIQLRREINSIPYRVAWLRFNTGMVPVVPSLI